MAQNESDTFNLVIVDPDKVRFEGEVRRLIAPGVFQDIAILPHHTPLYAQLNPGEVHLIKANREEAMIPIEGGIIRVRNNKVSVVVGFEVKLDSPDSSKSKKS